VARAAEGGAENLAMFGLDGAPVASSALLQVHDDRVFQVSDEELSHLLSMIA